MAGLSPDLQRAMDALSIQSRGSQVLVADFVRWPTRLRLKIDVDRALRKVGTRTATEVRARLKRGQEAGGKALPLAVDAPGAPGRGSDGRFTAGARKRTGNGRSLNRTGSLIKSIKYDPRTRAVRPKGFRDDLGGKLRGRQESLLWVLIHTFRHRDGTQIDPMGVDQALGNSVRGRMARALDAELKRPGSGLVAELRRIRPRGRR